MDETGITYSIQQELANISKNKSFLDWTYLNRWNNPNFAEIVKHLYPGQAQRAALLNPWSYIWNIVWDKIKNFVWEAKTAYDIDFAILTESILTRWEVLLKYTNNWTNKWWIEAVRAETYRQNGDTEMIARIYPVYEWADFIWIPTNYLYVQSYNWMILKNQLYRMNSLDNLSNWEEVPLNRVYELSNLIPEQKIDNLPRLVEVVHVADRPLIDTVKSIINSIDRKIAEAEKHFNDYSEQFKLFQNIDIPKWAYTKTSDWSRVINWDKLWKLVRTKDYAAVWDIKIIKNSNELLDKALLRAEDQITQISAITDIPLQFLRETVRDSWVGAEVGSSNLFKRIQAYRERIEFWLKQCFNYLKTFEKDIQEYIEWPAIIRMSESDILTQQTIMLQNNLTSLKRAIQKTHNVNEEQADIIIEEIKQDQSNWLLVSIKQSNTNADALAKTSAALD